MAKLSKDSDAKLWVYRRSSAQDRQAAETEPSSSLVLSGLASLSGQFFYQETTVNKLTRNIILFVLILTAPLNLAMASMPARASAVVQVNAIQHNVQRLSAIPGLETFAAAVRKEGKMGLWAEGLFAFSAYSAKWGEVPTTQDTASLSSYDGKSAFFIHNFLGGDKLYQVKKSTRVAVILQDKIVWYSIDVITRYDGTPTGKTCGYQAPFHPAGQTTAISAAELINKHFSQPFAIQTCICENGKGGVLILTGTLIK
jgi:hypothetical protein